MLGEFVLLRSNRDGMATEVIICLCESLCHRGMQQYDAWGDTITRTGVSEKNK